MASSTRYKASLHEIRTLWSLYDLQDAHRVLDFYEDLEALARQKD